jgi:hypothetical protein
MKKTVWKDYNEQGNIKKVVSPMKIKDLIFRGLTLPLTPILLALSLQGIDIYVLARLK